jgi:hypothetical protein
MKAGSRSSLGCGKGKLVVMISPDNLFGGLLQKGIVVFGIERGRLLLGLDGRQLHLSIGPDQGALCLSPAQDR